MTKTAFITGITGQDGSYLAELLLEKGYTVHGTVRRSSTFNTERINHLHGLENFHLHFSDITDGSRMSHLMLSICPDEVYNLAAQSHVRVSFDQPIYTAKATGVGALEMLEAVQHYRSITGDEVRYYQASSSEMFGKVQETPQTEKTPFYPRSPYGVAKVFAHWSTVNYREAYGLHASCGILFNHECPRRGETFVTRKITRAATRIKLGLQHGLALGNLDARRDWGDAQDYCEAMWLMLQQEEPDDYVIASGKTYSVKGLLEIAFGMLDLKYENYVTIDPRYYRPTEVDLLLGDASKAKKKLGWEPKVSFEKLVEKMVQHDLKLAEKEKILS